MVAISPFRMRTIGAKCGYFLGFPLQYLILYMCIYDTFSFPTQSFLFFIFCFYHLLAPVLIYTYEAWHNPYAFAPGMLGRASRADEAELLEANRRVLRWYWDEGPLTAEYEKRPPGIGFRESST